MKWPIYCVAALSITLGCHDHDHGHGHDDHGQSHDDHGNDDHGHDDHGHDDHGHDDHGHGHDDHSHGDGEELPGESVTLWTDKAELFMEWDPFIVGRESRFLAHLTDMTNPSAFKAVAEGKVTVTVTVANAESARAEAAKPARLGIFIPSLKPETAGACTLTLSLESAALVETFDISPCTVYADLASAKAASDESETPWQIGFLKEQQWPIEFATAAARQEAIVPNKTVNAKILAVPGREALLTAGTTGRVSLATPATTLGSQVEKGHLLARIQPIVSAPGNVGALRADVSAAKAELGAAQAARDRLARLVASDSVPKRRLEEAKATVEVANARLSAATTRLASYQVAASGASRPGAGAFRVKAPIGGTLVDQAVTEGQTVSAGEPLFSIIDLDRVWVQGRVFEPDVPAFEAARTAWFTVDGRNTVFEINEKTGKLVTLGHVLDAKSRTVPVIFEVANPNKALRIGQFARLGIATGAEVNALVIPESAILQDGNQWVAFVHVSGEAFERRVLSLGIRSRGLVEVRSGLAAGERVVTRGAYDVKLAASAGGAPAHGHAH